VARSEPSHGAAWPYLFIIALLAWWTLSLLARSHWIFLDFVNLAFHEAGHLLFRFGGTTLHYLGGTLGQILVPLSLCAWFLLRERQPFPAAACFWWAGQSLINISVYMADARSLALPLVGGGDHDWNELFYRFGLLSESAVRQVSGMTRLAGLLVMGLGLAWCVYFVLPAPARRRLHSRITSRFPWMVLALERGA
jgi:hypothetical protein